MVRLAEDKELRETMAKKLLDKTKRQFSLAATCQTQLDIYESVCRRFKNRKEPRNTVAVCGAYGLGNSGDEAILSAILREIRETDPDISICVVSKKPKKTKMLHKVRAIHSFNLLAFSRTARKSRLYNKRRRQPDSGRNKQKVHMVLPLYNMGCQAQRREGNDVRLRNRACYL